MFVGGGQFELRINKIKLQIFDGFCLVTLFVFSVSATCDQMKNYRLDRNLVCQVTCPKFQV
jgi:hypothetical protein